MGSTFLLGLGIFLLLRQNRTEKTCREQDASLKAFWQSWKRSMAKEFRDMLTKEIRVNGVPLKKDVHFEEKEIG